MSERTGEPPHRKPRVPPGQVVTEKWPVLHHGAVPRVDLSRWTFRAFGLVANPFELTYAEFMGLPRVTSTSDIHCVTRWSRLDNTWEGVPAKVLVEMARPLPEARFALVHAEQGFTANLLLEDLLRDDVLFAFRHDGRDLTPEHGWPLRLVVPHLYFWKSAKWVRGLEFKDIDTPGFWERAGYHMRGDPWKEERLRSLHHD